MEHVSDQALIVAVALVAGMVAQVLARHLRVPGIVLLLAAGAILGPDFLGWVRPRELGPALQALVGFAVSIVLFEGGLNLDLRNLVAQAKSIRQLVTLGALVTAIGGTLLPMLLLGWDWKPSLLFGTLVIVTGPTVVTPLLRRMRVQRRVGTVLEAEGVFGDAIGAIIAVVALEVVVSPSGASVAEGFGHLFLRLGSGTVFGIVGGLIIGYAFKVEHLVPEGLENIFTLSAVLALFQGSNALFPESGIVAAIFAGLTIGNMHIEAIRELREFKEQLTVLMITLLFVLLAADVRLEQLEALGLPGLLTVALLMLVVRPLNVFIGTAGTGLNLREKLFMSWLAPRGIVAAAVASLFAQSLDDAGIPGGTELRALVFLVIAITVTLQGLSGGWIAGMLGLRRAKHTGFVILGANPLALVVGEILKNDGQEVLFLDSNPGSCREAEERGFRVLYGNALSGNTLQRAELDSRSGCVALTSNGGVNYAFARRAVREYRVPWVWLALDPSNRQVTEGMLQEIKGRVLFGEARSVDRWQHHLQRGSAVLESWRYEGLPAEAEADEAVAPIPLIPLPSELRNSGLPIAVKRRDVRPIDSRYAPQEDDRLEVLVLEERAEVVADWLTARGWLRSASRRLARN